MNVSDYKRAMAICGKAGLTLMAWGPGGVGKTQAAEQYANENGMQFCCFTTNTESLESCTGLPLNDPKSRKMVWTVPESLPIDAKKKTLLQIDEITDAGNAMQKYLYRLVEKGEINGHKLGKNVIVTCAGNRPGDSKGSSLPPAPMITRMVHVGVCCQVPDFKPYLTERADVDVDDWINNFAIPSNIRPEIVAFLKVNPDKLYSYQAVPRTWEKASKLMDACSEWTGSVFMELIKGTVGPEVGVAFFAYLRVASQIPNPALVYKSPATAPMPTDAGVLHALGNALVYYLDRDNAGAVITYARRIAKEVTNGGRELAAYLMACCANKEATVRSLPEFVEWRNENAGLMI